MTSFSNFCTWLSLEADRARSLESVVRTAGSFFTKLQLPDHTKHGAVKAHVKDLISEIGIEHETATTATPRMLHIIVTELINERYSDPFIRARERVQVEIEGLGGCRIGEVCGGGDGHGVLANEVCVLTDPREQPGSMGHRVVELWLEHSKTGFSRYLDYAGTTQGVRLQAADHMLGYFSHAGFKVITTVQNGITVQRPDYWVLRVSLLGLGEVGVDRLLKWAERSGIRAIEKGQRSLQLGSLARQRHVARGAGSQEKRYINLMGAPRSDPDLDRGLAALELKGFKATITPGPLLLSTTGGSRPKHRPMPLAVSTAFAPTKELLEKSYLRANADPADTDPDLDLRAGEAAKWSTHSLRRLANTTARRHRKQTGATSDEIDLYFGWQERILKKAMQVHYAAMSILERMSLAKITGMM